MATATTPTTTPGPTAIPSEAPADGLRPYRMTVDQFQKVADSGALGPKSKVILWKGQLVEKVADMTKNRPHATAFAQLLEAIVFFPRPGFYLDMEHPLAIGRSSMPEPDFKFVRGRPTDYGERAPTGTDAPLVIEVSDTSLRLDLTEMREAYAGASVAVYWVVNLPDERIEVFSGPSGPGESPTYAVHKSYGPGEEVPVVLDGREVGRVAVSSVLP